MIEKDPTICGVIGAEIISHNFGPGQGPGQYLTWAQGYLWCKVGVRWGSHNNHMDTQQETKMLVQDKVTGEWYDPQEEFEKIMEDPEVVAIMERLKDR